MQIDEPPTPYCFDVERVEEDDGEDSTSEKPYDAMQIDRKVNNRGIMTEWSSLQAKLNYEQHRQIERDNELSKSLVQCIVVKEL